MALPSALSAKARCQTATASNGQAAAAGNCLPGSSLEVAFRRA